jgi:hypothetical protein
MKLLIKLRLEYFISLPACEFVNTQSVLKLFSLIFLSRDVALQRLYEFDDSPFLPKIAFLQFSPNRLGEVRRSLILDINKQ